ncbi:MAG: PTS sugar transporter subunit IIA [Candidatus Marinimicrobia bacterium]|nr:PTS sugar transporter subunit IIA [Candidatus Neomarinimicrobiota bacterium]MDD5582575.1 PTS sugar transporter subunit IIA [Candidatus Neomarinimicrobiota bacterium]
MDEIMTLEEVADYLRVSDRTVYEWAQKGEIPGGKIGTSWRFKRSEIESWVNRRLTPRLSSESKDFGLTIASVLQPDSVKVLKGTTKWEVLDELADLIIQTGKMKSKEELMNALRQREALMSTGIGLGIAVPHVRLISIKSPVMALGVSRQGILDYESLDGKPINFVIMIAAGRDQHAEYIRLLSFVSTRMKDESVAKALLVADEKDLWSLFTGKVQA